jgi:hypothetical protein
VVADRQEEVVPAVAQGVGKNKNPDFFELMIDFVYPKNIILCARSSGG